MPSLLGQESSQRRSGSLLSGSGSLLGEFQPLSMQDVIIGGLEARNIRPITIPGQQGMSVRELASVLQTLPVLSDVPSESEPGEIVRQAIRLSPRVQTFLSRDALELLAGRPGLLGRAAATIAPAVVPVAGLFQQPLSETILGEGRNVAALAERLVPQPEPQPSTDSPTRAFLRQFIGGSASDFTRLAAQVADFIQSPQGLAIIGGTVATGGAAAPFLLAPIAAQQGVEGIAATTEFVRNPTRDTFQQAAETSAFALLLSAGMRAGQIKGRGRAVGEVREPVRAQQERPQPSPVSQQRPEGQPPAPPLRTTERSPSPAPASSQQVAPLPSRPLPSRFAGITREILNLFDSLEDARAVERSLRNTEGSFEIRPGLRVNADALRDALRLAEQQPELSPFQAAPAEAPPTVKAEVAPVEAAPPVPSRVAGVTREPSVPARGTELPREAAGRAIETVLEGRPEGDFAANINLRNLSVPEDVLNVIRQTAELDKARIGLRRRGRVTEEQTRQAADRLIDDGIITVSELKRLRKGQILNSEQQFAARRILNTTATRAANAAREATTNNTTGNLLRAQQAILDHVLVQRSVAGSTAEVARALRQQRFVADALREGSPTALEQALDQFGRGKFRGREFTETVARKLAEIPPDDVSGFNRFLRSQAEWTTREKLEAYWISNILSGGATQVRNTGSNAIFLASRIPEAAIQGIIDVPLAKLGGRQRARFLTEARPMAAAILKAIPEGYRKAVRIMEEGIDFSEATKLEVPRFFEFTFDPGVVGRATRPIGTVLDLPGRAIRAAVPQTRGLIPEIRGVSGLDIPTRGLAAMDVFFRILATEGHKYRLAMRDATREGLKGEALAQRFADNLLEPSKESITLSEQVGRETTFTNDPGAIGRAAISFRRSFPGGRFIAPFVRTLVNIIARGFERVPGTAAIEVGRQVIRRGERERTVRQATFSPEVVDAVSRNVLGGMVLLPITVLVLNDRLTGAAPRGRAERARFFSSGKKPFSIRVGDKWISYQDWTEPFSLPLATVAAIHDAFVEEGPDSISDRLLMATGTMGRFVQNRSGFFRGIDNLIRFVQDPKSFSNLPADIAQGFIPFNSFVRRVATGLDTTIRDTQTFYNRIRAGIPFVSETVPPRLDPLGRTITRRGLEGRGVASRLLISQFAPVIPSPAEPLSAVDRELDRLKINVGFVGRRLTIRGEQIELTNEQRQERQQLVGQLILERLQRLIHTASYRSQSNQRKGERIDREIRRARIDADKRFKRSLNVTVPSGNPFVGMPPGEALAAPSVFPIQ